MKNNLTNVFSMAILLVFFSTSLSEAEYVTEKNYSPWSTWPKLPVYQAGAQIQKYRVDLLEFNMVDTADAVNSDKHPITGEELICDERHRFARSLDGRCNIWNAPAVGMVGMPFGRNVRENSTFPENSDSGKPLVSPTPVELSDALMTRKEFIPAKTINVLVPAWIQFMTHDWFNHSRKGRNNLHKTVDLGVTKEGKEEFMFETLRIKPPRKNIEKGVFDSNSTKEAQTDSFEKTNPVTGAGLDFVTRNQVSHWWDGSQLYGWDQVTHKRVREFSGGRMKLGRPGQPSLLPIDPETGAEIAAFQEGLWVGTAFLHTLFVNEHNRVSKMLVSKHKDWDDQKIFDVSRLIITALMAKIHTIEWTTAVISHPIAVAALQANWNGALPGGDAAIKKSLEPIAVKNPKIAQQLFTVAKSLGGIVGMPKAEQDGVDYALTEAFAAVYRLHPLLPQTLHNFGTVAGHDLGDLDFYKTVAHGKRNPLYPLLTGTKQDFTTTLTALGTNYAGALTLNNFPHFMRRLPVRVEVRGKINDMAAIDIGRDRERGIPRYNKFREELGLKKLTNFNQFLDEQLVLRMKSGKPISATDEKEWKRQLNMVSELQRLYKNDIDSVDLLIGSLAENTRPEGFGFGETSFQIFILNASRRLLADRFFTENYNAETYTQEGLDWVARETMTSLIRHHFPGVSSKLKAGENAFTPWGKGVSVPTTTFRNTLSP